MGPPMNVLDKTWSRSGDPRTVFCQLAMLNYLTLFIIQLIWLFVSYLK